MVYYGVENENHKKWFNSKCYMKIITVPSGTYSVTPLFMSVLQDALLKSLDKVLMNDSLTKWIIHFLIFCDVLFVASFINIYGSFFKWQFLPKKVTTFKIPDSYVFNDLNLHWEGTYSHCFSWWRHMRHTSVGKDELKWKFFEALDDFPVCGFCLEIITY